MIQNRNTYAETNYIDFLKEAKKRNPAAISKVRTGTRWMNKNMWNRVSHNIMYN